MNRSSFRALFAVLTFIALANLIPTLLSVSSIFKTSNIGTSASLMLWALVLGLSVKFWRRYDNLKNFKEASKKMEEKLLKLREKVENS